MRLMLGYLAFAMIAAAAEPAHLLVVTELPALPAFSVSSFRNSACSPSSPYAGVDWVETAILDDGQVTILRSQLPECSAEEAYVSWRQNPRATAVPLTRRLTREELGELIAFLDSPEIQSNRGVLSSAPGQRRAEIQIRLGGIIRITPLEVLAGTIDPRNQEVKRSSPIVAAEFSRGEAMARLVCSVQALRDDKAPWCPSDWRDWEPVRWSR